MPSLWNPISGASIDGAGTIYNSSFVQANGYFSPWAGANYPIYPASSPFYAFSAETGYGGGDTSLSSLSNAGYGGTGYSDTGIGLSGGPSAESFAPGIDGIPDSLIFDQNAVPTTPGGFAPAQIASLEFIKFRGYSPDIPQYSLPQTPGTTTSGVGNQFAGGLEGARNRAKFFGLSTPVMLGPDLGFRGGVFGAGHIVVAEPTFEGGDPLSLSGPGLALGYQAAVWGAAAPEPSYQVGPGPKAVMGFFAPYIEPGQPIPPVYPPWHTVPNWGGGPISE